MPVATSFGQIRQMIGQEIQVAMNELSAKALEDMKEETMNFYSIGSPTIYTRTGKLGSSPRVTGVSGGGDYYSFDMYLEPQSYTVPNPAFTQRGYASYFSPLQILNAAEYHFAHVLGRPGFWNRSRLKVEHDGMKIFSSHFN